MNLYIWHDAAPVTAEYHNGGGLLVIAPSLYEARLAAAESLQAELTEANEIGGSWETDEPDLVLELAESAELPDHRVLVHPDKGCC